MHVEFCDLCGNPIKYPIFYLTITEYKYSPIVNFNTETNENAYQFKKEYVKESEKEICATCHDIHNKIFEKRMIGIIKLANDLKTIYQLPTKEHNNGKNKKKKTDK